LRDIDRAADDADAFDDYIANHAPSQHNSKGFIEWEGSEAQQQLKEDIAERKHEQMTPKELFESRPVYQTCSLTLQAFRDHIYQIVRTEKYYHTLKVMGRSQGKPNG